jgi:ABC-type nitrate/sulfonate/bicarbonate transport system ATPase subunit
MAGVEIHGLVWAVGNDKQYRLDVNPFWVAAGEIGIINAVAAVGSALSDVLVGLARPLRGDMRVWGKPVGDLPPGGRGIGLVPSGGGLLPHLTVERNVEFGLGGNMPRPRRRAKVGEALEALQLTHLRRLRPHEISPEQRLRVAVARVMCASPETVAVVVEDGVGPATCRAAVMTAAEQDLSVLVITGVFGRAAEIPWRVRAACRPVPACGETC